MQQRKRHSTVAIANGNGDISREERRTERRLAKERRGVKKLRRVKRSVKYRQSPWGWDGKSPMRLFLVSFSLFALIGLTAFEALHRTGSGARPSLNEKFRKKYKKKYDAEEGEYNSDNAGGSLLNKLRGGPRYTIPESMSHIGDKAKWYLELRREYDTEILPKDDERSVKFVEDKRKQQGKYEQPPEAKTPYDIFNCPEYPPHGYPMQWPVLEVLENWPPDDATPQTHREIYQGLCVFDYRTELHKAKHYQNKEVPFVMRNDPAVARTAERWNYPGYMEKMLMGKEDKMRRTEYSPNNHFMYWADKRSKEQRRAARDFLKERQKRGEDVHAGFGRGNQEEMAKMMRVQERLNGLKEQLADARNYLEEHEEDDEAQEEVNRLKRKLENAKERKNEMALETWQPPTENLRMTYLDWLEHANVTDDKLGPDNPHWYFRLIGCGKMGEHTEDGSCDKGSSEWLFDELTFFQPREGAERSLYLVEPRHQKGIHCRFGMKGVIAENHFDLSRNAITLLGGQRRYILGDPGQCNNMNLLPRGHPSARHSAVDWSDPDLETFPTFLKAHVNEIVMQPGDVLYLPTNWFHYIISLELNMQCNTRSGGETLYRREINDCGF